ncbi:PLD nuclease N-terminal domain-containing protein [Nocardioides sp. LS1]|uniref:PLD nuclease N-terminal domain-containing protein n=1 Tax=Nocardioides sp. LS1 TaxID=1027620 RepID=UPI0021AB927D|nr:PLD nuclease N-terminal domain-containing protein [Nocardioides sp. LS1]
MIKLDLLVAVVSFALWVYCLIDVISTPEARMRNLPKVVWVLLVLIFPLVGSIAWLVAGRAETNARRSAHEREAPGFPEYDRPGRAAPADPAKDEEFLRQVRERAEEQRRRHEQARRERERLAEEERERLRRRRDQDGQEA